MRVNRLNDAAITLSSALRSANIRHGIFGGFAVSALGGMRESKDIDCLATATKEQVVEVLERVASFSIIPQARKDHVAVLWRKSGAGASGCGKRLPVPIKIFLDDIPRACDTIKDIPTAQIQVSSQASNPGIITVLDPIAIFKGKLAVAANRYMQSDATDICWLASQYRTELHDRSARFDLSTLSSACASHPVLFEIFKELGVDRNQLLQQYLAKSNDIRLSGPLAGQVQRVLLEKSDPSMTRITFTSSAYGTLTDRSVCMAYSGHDKT